MRQLTTPLKMPFSHWTWGGGRGETHEETCVIRYGHARQALKRPVYARLMSRWRGQSIDIRTGTDSAVLVRDFGLFGEPGQALP